MFGLTRWSPLELHREVDDLFNRFFGNAWPWRLDQGDSTPTWRPAVESYTDNGTLCIRVALPGVDPKDLDIQLEGDVLVISGEKKDAHDQEQGTLTYSERRYGSFRRALRLSSPIEPDKVRAEHRNGVVTITLTKAESVRPKRIQVKAS